MLLLLLHVFAAQGATSQHAAMRPASAMVRREPIGGARVVPGERQRGT
jgi:hypothetical protein